MTNFDYNAPAELFLGKDLQTAIAQGPRQFRTAAKAIRFAMEEAAPVSLHGALLRSGGKTRTGAEIARLYRDDDYPLMRKRDRAALIRNPGALLEHFRLRSATAA